MTDFPDRFLDLDEIYMESRGKWEVIAIEESSMISGRPVLKIAGFNTPEDVARLTNNRLAVTRDQLVELPSDTFYVFDLIDCAVIDGDTGEEIGTVVDIVQYPANDVYVIRMLDGSETLCPAVREFVMSVDVDGKKVVVRAAGLRDSTDESTRQ